MRIHQELETVEAGSDLHLAVGIFDGVHLGHQAVIESAIRVAHARGGLSGVLTFTPHPSRLFRPENPTLLIQPPDHKAAVLEGMGLDVLIRMPFTRELAAVAARDFVPFLKQRLPSLRTLHIGENFRFGKGRDGDVDTMLNTARPLGVHVVSVQRLRFDGEPVSSTRIREVLKQGALPAVNDLLGYNYFTMGTVVPGRRLGREIGFPTLNLRWAPECRPPFGVYVVTVQRRGGGPLLPAVANYGTRPTVENAGEPLLESHLLVPCDLGEGDEILVQWLEMLRPELRLGSLDELKTRIARDADSGRAYFQRHMPELLHLT